MEEHRPQGHGYSNGTAETKDFEFTDFMGKKEEKPQDDATMIDKHEGTEIKEKHTLLEELNRTRSSLNSSSDEEAGDGAISKKRKKKKSLKDKIKEKLSREQEEECIDQKDTPTTIEGCDTEGENGEATNSEEKKGFLDKIKEKLPGQHKKTEEGIATAANQEDSPGGEIKENKEIMDKIKEKLPGHQKTE